jgi:hypothetical protein
MACYGDSLLDLIFAAGVLKIIITEIMKQTVGMRTG